MWKILNLPLPYYGPEDESGSDDGKSEVQRQRDSIKVTSGSKQETQEQEKDAEAEVSEGTENQEEENQDEEEGEDEKEEQQEEGGEQEPKELTAEQKQIQALERKIERLQKRVGKTAGERDAIRKELKDTKASLDAKLAEGEVPLTDEEVNRRAQALAAQELSVREFNRAQEKLIDEATKIDKQFMTKINEVAANVAPIPQFIIEALNDLDNGGAVLNHFANNEDDYEEIVTMIAERKPPIKVLNKINKLSERLIEEAKPKPKKISGVPTPPSAPGGNRRSPDTLPSDPTKNMEEFIRVRNMQEEERRKRRR